MKFKLLVKQEAVRDMAEAFEWYETQRTGLGSEFLDEVDVFLSKISSKPEHYQKHGDLHAAFLHRFPYKIAYEIEQETVVVYAVFHGKRNPEVLPKRKK